VVLTTVSTPDVVIGLTSAVNPAPAVTEVTVPLPPPELTVWVLVLTPVTLPFASVVTESITLNEFPVSVLVVLVLVTFIRVGLGYVPDKSPPAEGFSYDTYIPPVVGVTSVTNVPVPDVDLPTDTVIDPVLVIGDPETVIPFPAVIPTDLAPTEIFPVPSMV